MIRVPTVGLPDIQPTGMPAVRNPMQVSAEGMGANVGEALVGFGDRLGEIGRVEEQKANLAALNQARIALAQHESTFFDPNNPSGALAYKGKDALQVPGLLQSDLSTFASQYRQNLTNPVQKEMFDRLVAEHYLSVSDRANSYAEQQKDDYLRQSMEGSVGVSMQGAVSKAGAGDTTGAQQAMTDGIATIRQYGEVNGWAPEYTQYSVGKFTKTVQGAIDAANLSKAEVAMTQDPQGFLADSNARLGLGKYSPDAQAVSGDPNAPRGIRNNNPGNIKQTGIAWNGEVPGTDPSYVSFSSPEAGIRALALNAQHLQERDGAQTVGDLISKWAPESDHNDTQAYIGAVSKQMGIDPSTPIDLQDPKQLTALTNAIITHENGQNPYSPEQVQAGVMAAMGKGKIPPTHVPLATNGSGMIVPATGGDQPAPAIGQLGKSGNPLVDNLKPQQLVELHNRALDLVNKDQVGMRTNIEQRVRDDTAAFRSGQTVQQPLTLTEFTQAYGDKQGVIAYGAYAADQQLGKDLQTVSTLTPQQMQALQQARTPQPGQNFAVKEQDAEILDRAMHQTLVARVKDPVQWAMQAGVGGLKQLDLSDPDKLADSIVARVAPMQSLAQQFQMPNRILTDTEKSALSQTLNGMPAMQKATFLGALSTRMQGPAYQQVLSALGANSPVAATAGTIMGAGHAIQTGTTGSLWWKQPTTMSAQDVAETMLTGEALITGTPLFAPPKGDKDAQIPKTPKFAMPPDTAANGLRATWNDMAGDAFRGDGAAEMQAYQAYRAMYAGLAAKQGKVNGVLDTNIAQEAARATLGNVVDWDGHNVIPPYGMDEGAFTDAVNKAWQGVRANVPGADGEEAGAFNLDRLGPNTYTLSSAGAPVRDKDGKPVVLRIAYPAGVPGEATADKAKPSQPNQSTGPMTLGAQVMANINSNGGAP
ncbi:MAG: hypothetical protein OJF61_001946 [Rhodanobacteraceae bacterium]|jgi:hypothetical protein|nr:MAG: hypothetical protein OJF61_001946 [Rhodanobacteraceae bacterium]